MIALFFISGLFLGLGVLAWLCDRMDAHDDLYRNELTLRCQAFHPAGKR